MQIYKRTGENSAISYGWVGMLIVGIFNVVFTILEIVLRLTVAIITWIGRGVRWLWRTAHHRGRPAGPAVAKDDLPSGASAPELVLADQPWDLPSGV